MCPVVIARYYGWDVRYGWEVHLYPKPYTLAVSFCFPAVRDRPILSAGTVSSGNEVAASCKGWPRSSVGTRSLSCCIPWDVAWTLDP